MNVRTVSFKSSDAPREFASSLRETGFAVLTDHPIAPQLIEGTYREWETFFSSEEKHRFKYDSQLQAGYFPFRSENAKDYSRKDLKEFFHYYPKRAELPPIARSKTPELYRNLFSLGAELLNWIEENTPIEIRKHFSMRLSDMIDDSEETLLRILHYPPLSGKEEEGAVRAAAHEDINLITLLPAATAPGLEVKDTSGKWHSVECDPGMIVVNCGDMLQEVSDGYYPSTTHRVVNPSEPAAKERRYSMPLFLHPKRSVHLSSTRTAGEYLNERLMQIGLIPRT